MRFTLHRLAHHPRFGTGGVLLAEGGLALFTVEQSWRDNRVGESCVPAGDYELEPHEGVKYTGTWALVGDSVSHYPDPEVKPRSACLIHAANFSHQLKGCIAPGRWLMPLGTPGVTSSRKAMATLTDYADPLTYHELEIVWECDSPEVAP